MFESLLTQAATTQSPQFASFMASLLTAIVLGLALALVYGHRNRRTKEFVIALAALPAIVCVVIAMVNGNIGAGVAVAGAFSLVRFRSAPGSARDITFIFLAICIGLVTGMGQIAYAAIVTLVLSALLLAYQHVTTGLLGETPDRTLRVTVPEDLDFTGLFEDVLDAHTRRHELVTVKTANMGSLYRLVYDIQLKDPARQRDLIDAIRCRNGNLEVSLTYQEVRNAEL